MILDFNFLFSEFNYIYYIIIASIVTFVCYVIFYPYILGGIYLLFMISFLGGILGGKFLSGFIKYLNNFFSYYNIELFAVLLGSFILNLIFYFLSKKILR